MRACLLGVTALALDCAPYDADLLGSRPGDDAEVDAGGSSGGGGSSGTGGGIDGAVTTDSGSRDSGGAPADAQADTGAPPGDGGPDLTDGGGDAGVDASEPIDAGCGVLDANEDCCPSDPGKLQPGACGCGVADSDGDADSTPDCMDGCPGDAMKTAPGTCGCGRPESDQGSVASCTGLLNVLVHRYRFDGTGTAITDSRGTRHGTLVNTTLSDTGALSLAGGTSNQYVDLPNGMISSLTDATFEVWLTWAGAGNWERIFDFGNNDNATEGNQGNGVSYLFLTPRMAGGTGALRVAYSVSGSSTETRITASQALSSTGMRHVAVVFDDAGDQMRLYIDGAPAGSVAITGSLSAINDINNWLGRSQYSADPELGATLHELRIYGAPLRAEQVALSFADGPDPAYLEP